MPSDRITKALVDQAVPRTDRPGADFYLWDSGRASVGGFGLKVTPAGGKTFVFQYRMRGARQDRRIKIGRYGDWTVDLARDRARDLRRMVDAGTDPLENVREAAKAAERRKRDEKEKDFSSVADQWLDIYKTERRRSGAKQGQVRSAATVKMVTGAVEFLKGQFAKQRIDEIDDVAVNAALAKIPAAKAATRRNVFASARILWTWAVRQRLVDRHPFDRLEAPVSPQGRDRALTDDELTLVMRASRQIDYPFGPIFRLLALTGQRREEVSGMTWKELDRGEKVWRIPGSRTKNGADHIVPLSPPVMAELDALAPAPEKGPMKWPGKGFVFTVTGKTAVSGHSKAKTRLDTKIAEIAAKEADEAPEAWRAHDLRRTLATGLQRLGVRLEVNEAVLNHIAGSRAGVAGIYQRHSWADEKRAALDAWADHVESLTRPRLVADADTDVVA